MFRHSLLLAASIGLVLAPACGGASDSGLFGGAGANTGVNPDGGGPDGSVTDGAGLPPSEAGHREGGGKDAAIPLPDASQPDTSTPDPGIACGATYCAAGTQECCRTHQATAYTFACMPFVGGCTSLG